MKDYYRILELHPDVSQEVMNKAYRALVQKYHPDVFHTHRKEFATERMREINEAYETLSNPASRKDYDVKYRATDWEAERMAAAESPSDWTARLQRFGMWFILTVVVLLGLKLGGRFLLMTTMGKLMLLAAVAWLYFRFKARDLQS